MRVTLIPITADHIHRGERIRIEGDHGLAIELTVDSLTPAGTVLPMGSTTPVELGSGRLFRIQDPWEPYRRGYVEYLSGGDLTDEQLADRFDAAVTAHLQGALGLEPVVVSELKSPAARGLAMAGMDVQDPMDEDFGGALFQSVELHHSKAFQQLIEVQTRTHQTQKAQED